MTEMLIASAPVASYTGDTKDKMWPSIMTLPVRQSAGSWLCSFILIFAGDIVLLHIFVFCDTWMLNGILSCDTSR